MNRICTFLFTIAVFTALASCGGGSSGGLAAVSPPVDSIDRSGRTTGPVSGFGSVFVNGVEFETDASTVVTVDGDDTATEGDLRVGEIVTIDGLVNTDGLTGNAERINHTNNVEGPITSITLPNSLVVLGQQVLVNADTVFDSAIQPNDITGLNVGETIEVSGFINTNRAIVATYVERKPQQTTLEVLGRVTNLSTANSTFNLGALVVDFSSASLEGFGTQTLQNDDFVEVKGDGLGGNGELIATRVEKSDDGSLDSADEGTEIETEGLITRFADVMDFDVNATRVTTNSTTVFKGGSSADLASDVRVEVEGSVDGNGILVADEISFKLESNVKVEAQTDSKDESTSTLVVLGVTVVTNPLTQFEDESDVDSTTFSLSELAVNEYVKISGIVDPDDSTRVLANRVERDNLKSGVELQGSVDSVNDPQLTVMGVKVTTDSSTLFQDAIDNSLSAGEFFGLVQSGSLLEIEGQENPNDEILASKVQLK